MSLERARRVFSFSFPPSLPPSTSLLSLRLLLASPCASSGFGNALVIYAINATTRNLGGARSPRRCVDRVRGRYTRQTMSSLRSGSLGATREPRFIARRFRGMLLAFRRRMREAARLRSAPFYNSVVADRAPADAIVVGPRRKKRPDITAVAAAGPSDECFRVDRVPLSRTHTSARTR